MTTDNKLILASANSNPLPRQHLSYGDQWRLDDIVNSPQGRRRFLAYHHMARICDNIQSERHNRWSPMLAFLAEADRLPLSRVCIPTMGGWSIVRYVHNDNCIFYLLERVQPEIEALRRTWNPLLATSVGNCVDSYKQEIASIRSEVPVTPPTTKQRYMELLSWLVPRIDDTLAALEHRMVSLLAEVPMPETMDG